MHRARPSAPRFDGTPAGWPPPYSPWHDPRRPGETPPDHPEKARRGRLRRLFGTGAGRTVLAVLGSLAGLALIVGVSGIRIASQGIGTVGVVRNGGPFDNRSIREVLMPGQGITFTGWYSQSPHDYPASNVVVVYEVSSDPARASASSHNVFSVPTKDGVQVGLDGALYLRFIGEQDITTLKAFDIGPGTRKFKTDDGRELYPWQGSDGFSAMLSAIVRPVLDSDLRREVAQFRCAQLVASCAIVRGPVGTRGGTDTSSSIALIEQRINDTLESDLQRTLGRRFFWDIHFRITRVTLPNNVQDAVDEVEAKYAQVNGARAEVLQARYENQRNMLLAGTYNRSPALATIEELKSAPPKATIIISTGGKTPTILAGK